MLVECGAEVIALSRTQADLDSLKEEVRSHLVHVKKYFFSRDVIGAIYLAVLFVSSNMVTRPLSFASFESLGISCKHNSTYYVLWLAP